MLRICPIITPGIISVKKIATEIDIWTPSYEYSLIISNGKRMTRNIFGLCPLNLTRPLYDRFYDFIIDKLAQEVY